MTISYAGVELAEGPMSKFYVAGGQHDWVEATRAAVSAGKDQAPPSQLFRDHVWVDQQVHGEAGFDVALTLFNVNITTGQTTYSYTAARPVWRVREERPNQASAGRLRILFISALSIRSREFNLMF